MFASKSQRRNAIQMTTTGSTQILDNALPLQTTSRTRRQHTLHVTCPAFALRAKAALTPQYTLTHNTLGKIIGRLYGPILHKRPQMLTMFDNPATLARQCALPATSFFKKAFHAVHHRLHSVLKSPPLQCPIANSFSQPQHLLRQTVKLLAYLAHRTFGLDDGLSWLGGFCAFVGAMPWGLRPNRRTAAWRNSSSSFPEAAQVLRCVFPIVERILSALRFLLPDTLCMCPCPYDYYRTTTTVYFNYSR